MSKYIIDIPKIVGTLEAVGSVRYTYFDGIQCKTIILKNDEIEELNSDYINEHYGDLQDDAYQRGYKDCETRYCSFDACPNRQAEYRRGLNDAWEAARKIIHMSEGELLNIFTECYSAVCTALQVLLKYDVSEAIEKLKAYEEKQNDKIEVGDEVTPKRNVGWKGVVVGIDDDNAMVMTSDGYSAMYQIEILCKTGRHFDIASILEDMRND